jgi:hypothetical protein
MTSPRRFGAPGRAWLSATESPGLIVLDPHADIQLDVGRPVVPAQPYTFPPGL